MNVHFADRAQMLWRRYALIALANFAADHGGNATLELTHNSQAA